ncbi:hypothetical protein [Sphingomonas sp. LT1P40]|uniref:hypothetical protein n=1 Tax=Alteristakelama amylovorans TaxID=3096166 RepID=UPI002FC7FFCC
MTEDVEERSALLGWPLLTALGGCLLLAVASMLVPAILPRMDISTLLLIGAGTGLALWLVVLLVGMRRPQWIVIAAALVLLPAAGGLAALGANRIYVARASGDGMTFAQLKFAPDGAPLLPSGAAGRGPISAAYHAALAEAEKDQKDYAATLGRMNLGALNAPYLLQQAPAVLEKCGSISGLEKVAATNSRRRGERAARLGDAVAASELSTSAKEGVRMIVVPETADAILANEIETIRAAREQCDLLARRTWSNSGGYFGFGNAGDWAKFRTITARRVRAAEELGRLQRSETDRRTAGREMVREELSR